MANMQNLRPGEYKLSLEEAKKGGKRSGEVRAYAKTFREKINEVLTEEDLKDIIKRLIADAKKGNQKAVELLRDTRGEKPTDKVETSGESKLTICMQGDAADWAK